MNKTLYKVETDGEHKCYITWDSFTPAYEQKMFMSKRYPKDKFWVEEKK